MKKIWDCGAGSNFGITKGDGGQRAVLTEYARLKNLS